MMVWLYIRYQNINMLYELAPIAFRNSIDNAKFYLIQMEIENNRKNKRLELEKEKSRQSEEAEEGDEMDEDDMEEVDSDEWDEENDGDVIPRNDCFFCLHHSSTLEKNAIHMSTEHSFFIPDVEYLVDLPGLFEYLGAKVIIDICSRLCF